MIVYVFTCSLKICLNNLFGALYSAISSTSNIKFIIFIFQIVYMGFWGFGGLGFWGKNMKLN